MQTSTTSTAVLTPMLWQVSPAPRYLTGHGMCLDGGFPRSSLDVFFFTCMTAMAAASCCKPSGGRMEGLQNIDGAAECS